MFRKTILTVAAMAVAAPIVLADAAFAGPQFNGPKDIKNNYTTKPYPHPFPKQPKPHKPHWHPSYRPVIVVQPAPIVQPIVRTVSRPVSVAPRPTNCLTKEYTPDGLIIFRDVCTKETATTAVPGTPAAAAMMQQQSSLQTNPVQAPAASQAAPQTTPATAPAATDGTAKN